MIWCLFLTSNMHKDFWFCSKKPEVAALIPLRSQGLFLCSGYRPQYIRFSGSKVKVFSNLDVLDLIAFIFCGIVPSFNGLVSMCRLHSRSEVPRLLARGVYRALSNVKCLTHFMPLVYMFSGDIERDQWHEMGKQCSKYTSANHTIMVQCARKLNCTDLEFTHIVTFF